jgi:choline dehydrogenase
VVGVEFRDSSGRLRKAFVTREVILAAYLNSAAILQRSGIGPADVLASAGITPVLINENVGQNFQVQGILQLPAFWANMTGTGLGVGQTPSITSSFTTDTTGVPTPSNRAFLNFAFGFYGVPQVAALGVVQNFPVSKGYIKVNSPDPFMSPQIYTGILSNVSDVVSYREDVRALILDITAYDPSFLPLTLDNATLYDNTALDTFIRANMELQYHYHDMTKMGTSAATSVIDARFRVHGMTGVRVCDNGVIPLTDGNPSLPVSAIGDICGRLILEDAGSGYARKPNRAPAAAKKKEARVSTPSKRAPSSLSPRALPSSPEICAAIETYITWIRANRGDEGQRLIDAIINGPVYTAHNCASA